MCKSKLKHRRATAVCLCGVEPAMSVMDDRPHILHYLSLPSRFLHWYQLILLGDRYKGENNLLKVAAQQCPSGSQTRDLSVISLTTRSFTLSPSNVYMF